MIFKELDNQQTPQGEISLRQRAEPRLQGKILYEVKLGDEYLMSSLFTEAEIQLSYLALASLEHETFAGTATGNHALDVVVGGLGLGYTAVAALENMRVKSLMVVDVMQPVISWHQQGLVPLGAQLTGDKRCQLIHADFFAVATSPQRGFDGSNNNLPVHAILLDIDHSPSRWLNAGNASFYTEQNLKAMAAKLHPGGVFGLWSDDLPDPDFVARLESIFAKVESHVVTFPNPYTMGESSNSVYLAHTAK